MDNIILIVIIIVKNLSNKIDILNRDGQPRSGPVLGPAQCIGPTIFEMESDRTNQSVH